MVLVKIHKVSLFGCCIITKLMMRLRVEKLSNLFFFSCNCMVSVASVNLFQIATREALSSSWMIQICMKSDVQ